MLNNEFYTDKTTVIAFSEDMFVPLRDCRAEQALISGSKLCTLDSLLGHFTMFGLFEKDFRRINKILGEALTA